MAVNKKRTVENKPINCELFNSFFDNNQAIMLKVNPESLKILDANLAAIDFYGYRKEDLLQKTMYELSVLPHDKFDTIVKEKFSSESLKFEFKQLLADNTVRDVEAFSTPLLIDNELYRIATVVDITARKLSENEMKTIFNTAASGMRLIDYEFVIKVVNDTFLDMVGLSEERVIGSKCYDVFSSELCNSDKCPLVQSKSNPYDKHRIETIKQTHDGKRIPVMLTAIPFVDEDGVAVGLVEDFTDISYHKKAEEKLNVYNQQLAAANQQLKAAEQQLRAANQQLVASETQARILAVKYRALFDGINDAAFVHPFKVDGFGKFVEVNEVALKKMGYTREEFLDLTPADISSSYDAEIQGAPPHRSMFEKDGFSVFEATHITKSGDKIPVEVSSSIFIYEGEKYILSVARDIADRKKTEAALAKLSTAVSQGPALIVITGLDGAIEYVNPKVEEVTGYRKSELIGENLRILKSGIHTSDLYKEIWDTITKGESWRGEFCNKKKNGELYWESALISPVFNNRGVITNYVKVAENITQQKYKEQIQKIIYNISNAVLSAIDVKHFANVVKKELSKLIDTTNYYIALYNDKTNTFTLATHFDEKDNFKTFSADKTLTGYVLKTKKTLLATRDVKNKLVASGEVELRGADSKVWLGIPLLIDDKAIGVLALQSYKTANAFNKSDVEMLEIVSSQISISINRKKQEEELITALEKAQESEKLKTAFLANMSHEIRTPMNGILGFTSLLKEADFSEAEKSEFINNISTSGERLLNTVNDLVNISKIEAGQMEVRKTMVSLNKLLNELYLFFKPEAEKKGLGFKLFLLQDELKTFTDDAKLHGILTNLIKNAIKFTLEGTVSFGYRLVESDVGHQIEFFVEDTGIGIPVNKQQVIFDRFVQADIEDTRVFEGSGLGLSISKAYAEMLAGSLTVQSEEGKGSMFTLIIPHITDSVVEQKQNFGTAKIQNDVPEFFDTDLLIVEDEEVSADYLEIVVKNNFRSIFVARNGVEAIELVKANPGIGVVLMDIKMPVMGGNEATQEIRKFNKEVIIIAQTAFVFRGDKERALDAGCNAYLTKPINRKTLLEQISIIINQ